MDIEKLLVASEVLGEVGSALSDLPEEKYGAVLASLTMTMARMTILDLAKYLQEGLEPYDALVAAASGKRQLSEEQQRKFDLMKLLAAKPAKE